MQQEECCVYSPAALERVVLSGGERQSGQKPTANRAGRSVRTGFFLVAASGLPEFRSLVRCLVPHGLLQFEPWMKSGISRRPIPVRCYCATERNLASVLEALGRDSPDTKNRIVEFLSARRAGNCGRYDQAHAARRRRWSLINALVVDGGIWRFFAENMSDGTLRALGVLTALLQSTDGGAKRVPLVGIEEPEMAVHPGGGRRSEGCTATAAK